MLLNGLTKCDMIEFLAFKLHQYRTNPNSNKLSLAIATNFPIK